MSKNQDLGELINGIKSLGTNQLNAPAYTSATAFTGTIAGYLGFDSSGNILTSAGASQWITSGSNIYYNTGNVGIATTNPTQKLSIGTTLTNGIGTLTPTCLSLDDTFGTNSVGTNFKIRLFQDNATNTFGFGVSNGLLEIVSGTGGHIGFFTNGANERVRISVNGNLGIGTNNPTAKLQVVGIAAIGQYTNGTSVIDAYDSFAFYGCNTASNGIAIGPSGTVSIGNTSTAYRLNISGDVNITGTYRVNGTPIGTGGGGVSGSGATNYISKWSGSTALTNSGLYEADGKLSYGTTSPFYQLDWKIKSNVQIGFGFGTVYSADDSAGLVAHGGGGILNTIPIGFAASTYLFYVGFTEAMRIDTNRNLLVNTSGGVTGGGSVQVNGDVNVTGTFRVNGVQYSTGGGGGGITGGGTADFIPKFTGSTSIGNSALWDNGNFSVHLGMTSFSGTGGDPQRYIAIYGPESSGIIFKGDINDSQATSFIKRTNGVGNLTLYDTREVYLQASSSNYFKMNGSGIGINVQPFGTPYVLTLPNNSLQVAVAFSWLTYSDGRVKKEIKEIEYGINEVMKMKPVQYKHYSSEFINNTLNIGDQYTNEIGFVAQDIHEIVKEAVNRGSDNELWSLDKSKLIPVLVKAVQELKAELDELKQNNA